jgi:Protein of unknown function (DUF2848)
MNHLLRFLLLGKVKVFNFETFPQNLVIAGWTGRDPAAIKHHIDELAALGVPRPSAVPLFYQVAVPNLTQAHAIQVLGEQTSGEVEPVLVAMNNRLWLTVGSDHTDRQTEAYSVAISKQACAKVLADQAWSYDEIFDHLDTLELRSWIDEDHQRVLYQEGLLAAIRPLSELMSRYQNTGNAENSNNANNTAAGPKDLPDGTVMFCGTVAAKGGVRPASQFHMELFDPVLDRRISHRYRIEVLPIIR